MRRRLGMSQDGFTARPFGISLSVFLSFKTCWNVVVQGHSTEWHDHFLPAIPTKTKSHKLIMCHLTTKLPKDSKNENYPKFLDFIHKLKSENSLVHQNKQHQWKNSTQ